ncbi:TonB-dependent receptor plug domain-containing protein [Pontibacter locisalis]|uniref:TonB-dependent receptor plug domain-containing protein n=1 Tax=Pontibacter locisalis TaxID=1719035 RepID=A0ABW5IM92_9BACT
MLKLLGLLFPLLLLFQLLQAQSIKVVDKTTLQPLPGVLITSLPGKNSVQTNAKGEADISQLIINAQQFKFNYVGYQSRTISTKQLPDLNFEVALSQQSHNLNEVVVSVGRFTEQEKLVPQQVEVLTRKELSFMSQPTTADVVQQSGKVLVQKSQLGGGSPIIRGFEANKVLLVVDGVRMNNAIYRGGHLQNVITLDNSMLERAEIVFGPGSVIYGSDALGGVLHFHTLKPALATTDNEQLVQGSAFTRYASAPDEKTIHAQLWPPEVGESDRDYGF